MESYHLSSKHGLLHSDTIGHSFNGHDDFIQLPSTWGGPGWATATIEAWIRPAANTGDFQAILSSADQSFVHFQIHNAGNITAYTDQGAVVLPVIPVEPLNTWRHVAVIIKSGASKVLVDGDQLGATNTKTFNYITASDAVSIGRGYGNGRLFKGNIGEVKIFHAAHEHAHIHGRIYQYLVNKPTMLATSDAPAASLAGLRSAHSKYVSSQPDGSLTCDRDWMRGWEKFSIERKDGKVGLKGAHGKYISAQPDGTITCDRDWLQGWELFTMEEQGDKVGFKSAHGKYISAQPDGTITCDRDWLRGWELFTME